MCARNPSLFVRMSLLFAALQYTNSIKEDYLRYVKDGCFIKGEALSCVKYNAVKIAKKAIFGDIFSKNETLKANQIISLVPLDEETIRNLEIKEVGETNKLIEEPRSILSEWSVQLAKYFMKVLQEFFKTKGVRVNLPEGARTIEEEVDDENARGKRKKLAVIIPLLTFMAAIKTKLLMVPLFLSVLLIKKILLIAALLLPNVLSTLKACKHHHPMTHYSYFGNTDSSDYSADYGSNYAYSASGGYGKDWASNRAYNLAKHRATQPPTYITAPGVIA